MMERGLISAGAVHRMFAQIEPELFRFPAIDPASFRHAVDDACPPGAA
jgi:hypothetical protein